MKKKYIQLLIVCLFLTEILSLFLTYKSFLNKDIQEVKEIKKIDKKQFAMFIETDNGYEEYLESNKFPEGYQINLDKSKCVDTKGNEIEGILSGRGTNVTVKSTTTSYCYLYFDIGKTDTEKLIENVSSDTLWASTLEDDGYRYVGTDPSNYVCFGYSDATTDCDFTNTTNSDLYAYRIIGIFEDSSGEQHLKLIKKEALNTSYVWHDNKYLDIDWQDSDLYKSLNGDIFLTNKTYVPNGWGDKIATWDYTSTNTLSYESGPDYRNNSTVQNIYLHEMNRSSKTNSIGEWKTISGKISLMYISDYLLSLGSSVLSYLPYSNGTTLKTGWMHISNNDSGAPSQYEWTSPRSGDAQIGDDDGTWYGAWIVFSDGSVNGGFLDDAYSVRPVFYLTSDVTISGEGTSGSPYIIS